MSLRSLCAAATLGTVLVAAGCSPSKPSGLRLQHASAHFTFHYTGPDRTVIETISPIIESAFPRVVTDLGADGIGRVDVFFYETHDDLADAVRPVVGAIPSWATGLVTSAQRIHLLSPRAADVSAAGAATQVVHEFAHCATLFVNPSLANNPRWLWEAIALYEAGESVDPRGLPYLSTGPYPTLSVLSVMSDRRIYDVGYLLGEFVVSRWGLSGLRTLIRSSGNVESSLGLATRDFETDWISFVRARYGMGPISIP